MTTTGGNQTNLNCIFKEGGPPNFYLVFPPDTLPININTEIKHPVSIGIGESSVSLNATILEKKGDRALFLLANTILDPASLREYFRINTTTSITASYEPSYKGAQLKGWTIRGQTQDLSGSGALALFLDEPKNNRDIFLEIVVPGKKDITIRTIAHIIRKKRLRSKRWQISFHFDNISNKHRDIIITYLLSTQRRQLREQVYVMSGNDTS